MKTIQDQSLALILPGQLFRIRQLANHPEVCSRLRELGFCENAVVRCVTKGYGNIICEVCNARFGIDSFTASNITVSNV